MSEPKDFDAPQRHYILEALDAVKLDYHETGYGLMWPSNAPLLAGIAIAQAIDRHTAAFERLIRITEDNILYRHEGADRRGFCCDGRPL